MKTINLEIQVPDWAEWVAMDEGGYWCAFSTKPEIQETGWWRLDEGSQITLTKMTPPAIGYGEVDWQQSLRKV